MAISKVLRNRKKKEINSRVRRTGEGKIIVNDRTLDDYFGLDFKVIVRQPLELTKTLSKFDVIARSSAADCQAGRCNKARHCRALSGLTKNSACIEESRLLTKPRG